jgi:iron-sulfur cluster repair protein YtfE (RIC family)
MCQYCGCKAMPLIRDYIAEHERATDHADRAMRALDHGDIDDARVHVKAMADELASHWKGEEDGVFTVMAAEEQQYAEYVAPLIQEHRELEELLATIDLSDPAEQDRFRHAAAELAEHITREEDGLFPATLTALTGAEWNAAMEAWYAAHPGGSMIPD